MPLVVLLSGSKPVTLCLTSEPVTLEVGVPLEVPQGYRDVLTNRAYTAPHVIADYTEPPAVEPAAPRGRKHKEA